jgi:hypothetical protein
MTGRQTSLDESRMFIYVKNASVGDHLLPVSEKRLYYGHSKWNTVMIQLNIVPGFVQVCLSSVFLSESRPMVTPKGQGHKTNTNKHCR